MTNHAYRLAVAAVATLAAIARAQDIPWTNSFDGAIKPAVRSHKLVMLDLHSDGCDWCKKLDSTTYRDKEVVDQARQVQPVMMNAERDGQGISKRYGITTYPAVLFIDPVTGKVISRVREYLPAHAFAEEIRVAIEIYKKLPTYESRFRAHSHDVWLMERLALLYAKQNRVEKAQTLVERAENLDEKGELGSLDQAEYALACDLRSESQNHLAITHFQYSLSITKDSFIRSAARLNLARCEIALNQRDQAADLLRILQNDPDTPDYFKDAADAELRIASYETQLNESRCLKTKPN